MLIGCSETAAMRPDLKCMAQIHLGIGHGQREILYRCVSLGWFATFRYKPVRSQG
jgi:hypothetical protein